MKALIVTGGTTDPAFTLQMIEKENYDRKIASDSGMHFYYKSGIRPDLVVGDFDSADPDILAFYEKDPQVEIERLNPIKDDTDTEHAIRRAIAEGAEEIAVFGATGTRIDHILGNISLLGIGPEHKVSLYMIDPYNRIRLLGPGLHRLKKEQQFGSFVSLIPYGGEACGVTLTGMKYPLLDYTMGGFNSLGISNEITEEEAVIELKAGYLLMIESRDSFFVEK